MFYWLKWWKLLIHEANSERVLLNSWITWLERNTSNISVRQHIIRWAMFNYEMLFHGEVPQNIWVSLALELVTYLLDWFYQPSFLRLFLVPRMFTKLNMNDNNRKIRLVMKKTSKLYSKKFSDSIFSQREELCLKFVKLLKK